jgi:hypothetical protein
VGDGAVEQAGERTQTEEGQAPQSVVADVFEAR